LIKLIWLDYVVMVVVSCNGCIGLQTTHKINPVNLINQHQPTAIFFTIYVNKNAIFY